MSTTATQTSSRTNLLTREELYSRIKYGFKWVIRLAGCNVLPEDETVYTVSLVVGNLVFFRDGSKRAARHHSKHYIATQIMLGNFIIVE